MRALIDHRGIAGVRELASRAEVDPGCASRILATLDSEAIVDRDSRGRIACVDWPALVRRWAEEAPYSSRGEARAYLDPRGARGLAAKLPGLERRYAVTGSLAASRLAPIAPPRLAALYVDDHDAVARELDLRPTDTGANVKLVCAVDDFVYVGSRTIEGVCYVAPSQAAADLLTATGRGPAEGEALIEWMQQNEGAWRE